MQCYYGKSKIYSILENIEDVKYIFKYGIIYKISFKDNKLFLEIYDEDLDVLGRYDY